MGDVVLLGEDLIERIDGNRAAQGIGNEVAHLGDRLLQHVVALVDAGIRRARAHLVAHVVLRRNLEPDGDVVLGFGIDIESVLHGAQAYRRCLAVDEGDLRMQARANDLVEAPESLDDNRMLLLDHEQGVGKKHHNDDDNDGKTDKAADELSQHRPLLEQAGCIAPSISGLCATAGTTR